MSGRLLGRAAVAAAALVGATGAGAHGGSRTQGYVSTFAALEPLVLGVSVNVFGPHNRVRLSNYSGKTIVLRGYQGESYLRFAGASVYENASSPTTYLNAGRSVPGSAFSGAPERWRQVARAPSYTWHDDRIVWTANQPPDLVRRAPQEAHILFDWRLPATADGKPFAITGFLGWSPTRSTRPSTGGDDGTDWALVAGIAAGAAACVVGAGAVLRTRRARHPV